MELLLIGARMITHCKLDGSKWLVFLLERDLALLSYFGPPGSLRSARETEL